MNSHSNSCQSSNKAAHFLQFNAEGVHHFILACDDLFRLTYFHSDISTRTIIMMYKMFAPIIIKVHFYLWLLAK